MHWVLDITKRVLQCRSMERLQTLLFRLHNNWLYPLRHGITKNGILKSLDVDECAEGTDNCAQTCHNTDGSFTCSCNAGYTTEDNGVTCIGLYCTHLDIFSHVYLPSKLPAKSLKALWHLGQVGRRLWSETTKLKLRDWFRFSVFHLSKEILFSRLNLKLVQISRKADIHQIEI